MIGLGVDVVAVPRFREALARTPALRERVFTDDERALAAGRADEAETLAVRFAAREAAMKALGVGLGAVDHRDVSVRRRADGAPELVVAGRAAALAAARGVRGWHVSLAHDGGVAMAVVAAH